MTDAYFRDVLNKYSKEEQHSSKIETTKLALESVIRPWAGDCLKEIKLSGSFAKNTQTSLTTDFDLFVSLNSTTQQTPKEIFQLLLSKLQKHYEAKAQNVSIRLQTNGHDVDIVPAKNQPGNTNDHWLYSNKKEGIIQTNIHKHINHVRDSNKTDEIKITKIWAKLHKLEFPSFYIELAVIESLKYKETGKYDPNFQRILEFLAEEFTDKRFVDPANTNNIISELLTQEEKKLIAQKAKEGFNAKTWGGVIW